MQLIQLASALVIVAPSQLTIVWSARWRGNCGPVGKGSDEELGHPKNSYVDSRLMCNSRTGVITERRLDDARLLSCDIGRESLLYRIGHLRPRNASSARDSRLSASDTDRDEWMHCSESQQEKRCHHWMSYGRTDETTPAHT